MRPAPPFCAGRSRWRVLSAVTAGIAGVAAACSGIAVAAAAGHPLDPLSAAEIQASVALLRAAGHVDEATRFALIDLDEPDKAEVLAWRQRPTQRRAPSRRAFVIARHELTVYEAVVDLDARRVESWTPIPGVQSAVSSEEWAEARRITKSDRGWQEAMRRRGYTAFDRLVCTAFSAGNIDDPSEEGRRLVRVVCFDGAGTTNPWARPVEGLVAVVDLDAGSVVRLIDTGPVKLGGERGAFGAKKLRRPEKFRGAGSVRRDAAIDGHVVRWRGWSFYYRIEPRAGLVLSLVRHDDAGRERLVLYRGSVAEMFVPYMDPTPSWGFRGWLDAGEYGFGTSASPLTRGIDCPVDAVMLDALFADARGQPREARSVACLFERYTGAPLWRHAESENRSYAGYPARELVMRTIPSLGNYDYVIDWVLTESGAIRVDVGATGIDAVKGVAAGSMRDPSATEDTAYGTLVAPNLVGVDHDHFLSLRLDLDIDGPANTLMRETPKPVAAGATRSVWTVDAQPVTAEGPLGQGEAHDGMRAGAAVWRIVNPNLTNRLGQHPGYELRPGHTATSLLPSDDFVQRRAGFSAAPLWLTAYDQREMYAAGQYPNQSRGDGLPSYAARHRPVANTDIVLWYTMGFHHLTRPEDWPVMSTVWHSVSLVPYGFFDRNPSVAKRGTRRQSHRNTRK
jgi:primary-amine oxidase